MWCCSLGLQSAPGETRHPGLLPRRLEPCLPSVHHDLEPLKVIGPYLLGYFLFLFTGVIIGTQFDGGSFGVLLQGNRNGLVIFRRIRFAASRRVMRVLQAFLGSDLQYFPLVLKPSAVEVFFTYDAAAFLPVRYLL